MRMFDVTNLNKCNRTLHKIERVILIYFWKMLILIISVVVVVVVNGVEPLLYLLGIVYDI